MQTDDHDDPDERFFREWKARKPGERRSLDRAAALLRELGEAAAPCVPVLTVVGSKGKGTAATYASAWAAAAGLHVVTVTSPALRSNRERIRLDGRAVGAPALGALGARLEAAMNRLPGQDGYLSPSGLFMIAGLTYARDTGADLIVLEAGMGGGRDETSLVPATLVAVTPVFAEHLGVLGDSPREIAAEKARVVASSTRAVVSAPQTFEVAAALAETVRERTSDAVEVEFAAADAPPPTGIGSAVPPHSEPPHSEPPPAELLPAGLHRHGAHVGALAAARLLELIGAAPPPAERLRGVLASVSLPGRLSWHTLRDEGANGPAAVEVLADCAIDRTGVEAALRAARARWGGIDHVLLCLPDHKDLPGAVTALDGVPVTFVRLPYEHLAFDRALPPRWQVIDADGLTSSTLSERGPRVVALGTVYFVGRVLDLVDAGTDRLFTPPP